MEYKCPECSKSFEKKHNLDRHIERMHKKPEEATDPPEDADPDPTKSVPVVDTPPVKLVIKTSKPPVEQTYHCLGCAHELKKDESPCPGCGAELNWTVKNG